jgi:hypothetical protein
MPKENDLEGPQDQGGGQAGMPKQSPSSADQGIVRDERGEEQLRDKKRAQQVSREDKGNDPPGVKRLRGQPQRRPSVKVSARPCLSASRLRKVRSRLIASKTRGPSPPAFVGGTAESQCSATLIGHFC